MIFDGWCKLIKIPTAQNTTADMATKILPAKALQSSAKLYSDFKTLSTIHSQLTDLAYLAIVVRFLHCAFTVLQLGGMSDKV